MRTIITKADIEAGHGTVPVLGNGYVRLVDHMGSDLSVANAARASYAKESSEFGKGDENLIKFLAKDGHMSPFRHAFLTFEFKAPLMVARQHWKYVVGSDHTMDSWNESSRRYITSDPEFYVPQAWEWRTKPENSKQGSSDPLTSEEGQSWTDALMHHCEISEKLYNEAMECDIAPEQARLFLPAYGMHLYYRWSCSLQSLAFFLKQRLSDDAQVEIQEYAKAAYELALPHYPVSLGELINA